MERSKMHAEAVLRMKALQDNFDLNPKILQYLEEGKLYYSYRISGWANGCIDTIDYDERYAKAVNDFEEKTGNYVYHVIETKSMGQVREVDTGSAVISYLEKADADPVTMLTLLYVSSDDEDWMTERLEGDYIAAYVMNLGEQDDGFYGGYYGEYGDVFLTSDGGALLRQAQEGCVISEYTSKDFEDVVAFSVQESGAMGPNDIGFFMKDGRAFRLDYKSEETSWSSIREWFPTIKECCFNGLMKNEMASVFTVLEITGVV